MRLVETALGKALPAGQNAFSDTTAEAANKAARAGLVDGMGNGIFAPSAPVTREQLSAMLYRAYGKILTDGKGMGFTPKAPNLSAYADAASVSDWAIQPVSFLVDQDILKGTTAATLSPKEGATVEQAVLLTLRTYDAMMTSEVWASAETYVKEQTTAEMSLQDGSRGKPFTDGKINELMPVERYKAQSGDTLHIFRLKFSRLAANPDQLMVAGGSTLDEKGWFTDEMPTYLVFTGTFGGLTALGGGFMDEMSPGGEVFHQDLERWLAGPQGENG